jgi:DMATS type aromatic prenyltransferase
VAAGNAASSCNWLSLLPSAIVPLEYSWKWDSTGKARGPEIRLTIEVFGELSGTQFDPLNQAPAMELLHRLSRFMPGVDQTLASYFLSKLFDHDKVKYMEEKRLDTLPCSTMLVCFEFSRTDTILKTYMSPRKIGQRGFAPLSEYISAIQALGPASSRTLDVLTDFLSTSPEGVHLQPFALAFDNVEPSSSRLKLYFFSTKTSYNSMREVLTLGGRISSENSDMEKKLRTIYSLAQLVMGCPENLEEDADIPAPASFHSEHTTAERATLLSGFQYYFDVAPGADVPSVKFYIPIRKEQINDRAVGSSLTGWFRGQGRGEFCDNYMRMLEGLARGQELGECRGLHSFISCMIGGDGEIDVTSYLLPGSEV